MSGPSSTDINYDAQPHERIYKNVNGGHAQNLYDHADAWRDLGVKIGSVRQFVDSALAGVRRSQTGAAADAAAGGVSVFGPWLDQASDAARDVAAKTSDQGDFYKDAENKVGPPVAVPNETGPEGWPVIDAMTTSDAEIKEREASEAQKRAREAMKTYQATSNGNLAVLPAFIPAPSPTAELNGIDGTKVGHGTDSSTIRGYQPPTGADPGEGLSSIGADGRPGGGPGVNHPPAGPGGTESQGVAPAPTNPVITPPTTPPPNPSPLAPPPGGGGTLPGVTTWPNRPGVPGSSVSPPPGGAGHTGGSGRGASGLAGGGVGPDPHSRAGSSVSRLGPGGSSGIGAFDEHAPQQRGGAAGARGAAGMPGMPVGPMGGARGGRGQEDEVHKRPSWLIETRDIFGDIQKVVPPVIGEEPPDYYK